MQDKFSWRKASFILIIIYIVLSLWRIELFPPQVDIYYHLGVMQGFHLAGGIVTWDFWEFAPEGKPHFYPPLLHILMLLCYRLGLSKISIAIFFSFIIFPLYIITFWFVIDRLFNSRLAFFAVLTNLLSYNLFLGITNTIAATLALVILFWLFFSLERNKNVSLVILTSLLFYAHYAISTMGIGGLVFYVLFRKGKKIKPLLFIALGMILALPWILHFAFNFSYLLKTIYYDRDLPVNILLLLLSLLGIFYCFRFKGKYLFFVFLVFFALLGSFKHLYRFFNTQGAVGIVFTAAFFLERLFVTFSSQKTLHQLTWVLILFFASNLLSYSVGFDFNPFSLNKFVSDSVYWNLLVYPFTDPSVYNFRGVCFYRSYGEEFKEAIDIINTHTD
ncbi:MAG: glycosyltransferase family 39 protein, partial [Candidatus Omnitrophica bacterium]|nr:glycosyltransferase family 39 protein [Candidatus Omnitrophota bacterium]